MKNTRKSYDTPSCKPADDAHCPRCGCRHVVTLAGRRICRNCGTPRT